MLDSDTKRRIDTCRDILVGKVPDPKSQVEQITIALIYKFMDDMDAEAEELGGKRNFFTGEFARYGWSKMMAPGLGGHEMLSLYAEAIQRMNENPAIPPLFRDIFKNAFLPYRDPETLRSFLKEIDTFNYDHSERLGDAFEYLYMDSSSFANKLLMTVGSTAYVYPASLGGICMPGHNGLFARRFPIAFSCYDTPRHSRVLSAPVRPVCHQTIYIAIVN